MEKEIENVREITLNLLAKTCQLREDDGENWKKKNWKQTSHFEMLKYENYDLWLHQHNTIINSSTGSTANISLHFSFAVTKEWDQGNNRCASTFNYSTYNRVMEPGICYDNCLHGWYPSHITFVSFQSFSKISCFFCRLHGLTMSIDQKNNSLEEYSLIRLTRCRIVSRCWFFIEWATHSESHLYEWMNSVAWILQTLNIYKWRISSVFGVLLNVNPI